MKIVNNTTQPKLVKLRTLKNGDCFLWKGKHYIVGFEQESVICGSAGRYRGDFCLEDSRWFILTDHTRNFLVEKVELEAHRVS